MKNEEFVLQVKNLNKIYNVYRQPMELVKEILLRRRYHEDFAALKNVNFSVKKGEVVGIIGRNGSGKSTLLKILAGILDYTSGKIQINGRLSAILDLGLGFNPEYTGRQNIYSGAMVLGMSKSEIDSKIQKIIDFSELKEFIDRPFKTYSAGMQARLTFAVATEIEPDILVIDEALAAGDMFFMSKCIDRMIQMCQSGATVLIVSHSTFMIRRLCTRTILISKGKILKDGQPDEVCTAYEMGVVAEESNKMKVANKEICEKKVIGSGEIKILKVKIFANGKEKYSLLQHDDVVIRIYYETKEPINNPGSYVLISRDDGVLATSYYTGDPNYVNVGKFDGKGYIDFHWPDLLLGDGHYLVTVAFYPEMKGPQSIQKQMLSPYVFHDKGWGFKVTRRGRPLQSLFDQKVKVKNHHSK